MKNVRFLKPFAVVFIVGVAAVAFGLAGQQALSAGVDDAGKKSCGASSEAGCSKGEAAASAHGEHGRACGREKSAAAAKTADLSTKEGRSQVVWAEYAATQDAGPVTDKAEGGTCGAAKSAACASVAKAEGGACGEAAKAEGAACGAVAQAEGKACGVTAKAEGAACAIQAAADKGACPLAAAKAVTPASDEKQGCSKGESSCCAGSGCASACGSGCGTKASDEGVKNASLNQQAKADAATLTD